MSTHGCVLSLGCATRRVAYFAWNVHQEEANQ